MTENNIDMQENQEGAIKLSSIKERIARKDNGQYDWESLINPLDYYLNSEAYKNSEHGDIKKLSKEDYEQLLLEAPKQNKVIPLKVLKELLSLRGFKKIKTKLISVSNESVVAQSKIVAVKNDELGLCEQEVIQHADASEENIHGIISKRYKVTVAENRALARAIRTLLGIHTVSKEELVLEKTDEEEASSGEFTGLGISYGVQSTGIKKHLKTLGWNESRLMEYLVSDDSFIDKRKSLWERISDIAPEKINEVLFKVKALADEFLEIKEKEKAEKKAQNSTKKRVKKSVDN